MINSSDEKLIVHTTLKSERLKICRVCKLVRLMTFCYTCETCILGRNYMFEVLI